MYMNDQPERPGLCVDPHWTSRAQHEGKIFTVVYLNVIPHGDEKFERRTGKMLKTALHPS